MQERGLYKDQDQPPSAGPVRTWGSWDQQQPYTPAYRQPFAYQPPRRAKSGAGVRAGVGVGRALGLAALGAAFVAIVAVIAGGIAYGAKHRAQAVTISAQTDTGSSAPAAPASSAPPAPAVVLSISGSGEQTTQGFSTGPNWGVTYSYNCSALGMQGNFIVSDENGIPLVNELGTSGSATTYEHSDPGRHYLQVESECSWTIQVTDGVGG